MILSVFWEFLKIGMFAIGGGLATLPFLYDISSRTGWFTEAQVADMLAVAQVCPGPIGINVAAGLGYIAAGIPGTVVAVLGEITPSIIAIIIVSRILNKFRTKRYVDSAFYGLRPASAALIAAAGVDVLFKTLFHWDVFLETRGFWDLWNWGGFALAAVIFILTNYIPKVKKWHPAVFIAFSAAAGIALRLGGA